MFKIIGLLWVPLMVVNLIGCSYMVQMSRHSSTPEPHESSRTFGSIIEDESIEAKILANLRRKNPNLTKGIQVISYNRVVLLAGKVKSEEINQAIVQVVSKVPHIRQIQNEIRVGAIPTFANDMYDTWLTTKLKSRMLFTRDFPSNKIKVSTTQGVLYLMGLVSKKEADDAIWISRRVQGIRKVVSLFEYIEPTMETHNPIQNAME